MRFLIICLLLFLFSPVSLASAHFGMIIPSKNTVVNQVANNVIFDIAFSHPFAGQGMDMEKPQAVTAYVDGKTQNLLDRLEPTVFMGKRAWKLSFPVQAPGVYQFAVSPEPYFEPAEDCFIVHYAKTFVAAFGEEDGWDAPMGLPMEIVPLTRPFGIFTNSVFQGLVLKNGRPLPWTTVEIENLNSNPVHAGPNEYYETQIVKTDGQGIFTAGIPWAGWWGFAALSSEEGMIERAGEKKDLETGGVLWVYFAEPEIQGKKDEAKN